MTRQSMTGTTEVRTETVNGYLLAVTICTTPAVWPASPVMFVASTTVAKDGEVVEQFTGPRSDAAARHWAAKN